MCLFYMYVFHVQTLQDDCVSMTQQRDYLRQLLQLNKNYEGLKTKLKENETNAQVSSFRVSHKHHTNDNINVVIFHTHNIFIDMVSAW